MDEHRRFDIARAEPGESEIEWVQAIPLTDVFGVTGPAELPCLPFVYTLRKSCTA